MPGGAGPQQGQAQPWQYGGPPPTGRWGAPAQVPRGWVPAPPPPPLPPRPVGGRPVTPPGAPPFDRPQPYERLMRARDWAWWRPVLGLLLFSVLYAVAAVLVVVAVLVTGVVPEANLLDLVDPGVLLMTNLSLIVAIPIVWACWAVAHGMRPGWSSSVTGRLRWRLFRPLTWRALLTLGVGVLVTIGISLTAESGTITGPDSSYVWLVLVVLLTTPLQSAAEEYVFRGYLTQALTAWIRSEKAGPVVAALVTATLFSAAHAPPDVLTFADRFAFGLAASWVTNLTGGLEAAIVLHAVNNVVVFLTIGLLGDEVATAVPPAGIGLLVTLLDLVAMGAYVWLVARSRAVLRPELVSPAVDLRGTPVRQPTWVPAPPLPPFGGAPGPPAPDPRWSRQGGA
ncbi:CPBP family intramembrane glutamic endopeptidase [Geodermatophilus sp. Leaf369]|uniref:CPBP family intramembrane glutamic endopeptidase n=1 Tax=Geodermatophilus sp. Leaf369 TaxID=1736354 RepID=UPI0012F97D30|nr:type II CAAX endopeptidase family protein [Geodermatophilus sp. Leaf369]